MRTIRKRQEPRCLIEYRVTNPTDYENFPSKNELRSALHQEQQALCCYCMGRIIDSPLGMKIEHWRPQSNEDFAHLRLDYKNLLGACLGGQGQPPNKQHCDTKKGHELLCRNPAEHAQPIELWVSYNLVTGAVHSRDPELEKQLTAVLNLNLEVLKTRRKAILAGMADWCRKERERGKGKITRATIIRIRKEFANAVAMKPYSPVAIWFLDRKLNGNNK